MKRKNYIELASYFEAYESATIMNYKDPENEDYQEAVNQTLSNLLVEIEYLLWDETPKGIQRPNNPYELE